MLVIQSGINVYGIDQATQKLKQLPLTYDHYATQPTAESLNASIDWLLKFLKSHSLPYTLLIDEESSRGPGEVTELVYANIMSGSTVKHTIALYTVASAITEGREKSLDQTLLEELT